MITQHPTWPSIRRSTLAISIAFSSLFLAACNDKQAISEQAAAAPVRPALVEVIRPQANTELTFSGIVQAANRADLAFRISGRLTELLVKEGSMVKKGQLLAKLDQRDVITALNAAQFELNESKAEFERAQAIYRRTQAISKSDLDKVETRFKLAANKVKDAQLQLDHTNLTAPFDGIIGRIIADNFSQVAANSTILTVQDLNDLEIVINVPHKLILSESGSQSAYAELSGIPDKKLPLKLRTYATEPDPTSQTYSVVLGITSLEGVRVFPGMVAKVIPVQDGDATAANGGQFSLPLTAIIPDNQGKQFVWVLDQDNKARQRYITLGNLQNSRVEVRQGVNIGEKVIIAGAQSVQEGMQVEPRLATNESN
ncbi:MAG: efflux RND transporter periplasmic adaptor subunit [Vibrionaceae bacterium]